ncbi:MAG: hypothetical protein EP318_16715 [Rhodobacteraceae bacterium]|nr:MAG: hypothetical protein EP318_16715 [Paracoccaceae bacterium]
MLIDIEREILISENLSFFESHLTGMASRHFFVEAVRCSKPQPAFFLAGVTCLLHGIEGALSQATYEVGEQAKLSEDHAMDRGEHKNLSNQTLRRALSLGFDIETLAFTEEQGHMRKRVKQNDPVGIVQLRNEFSHGKAFRATETIGHELISDTFLLAEDFKALLTLSYGFVVEVERFMGRDCGVSMPVNPFDY